MKHIIFILFVAMGFTCVAQNDKGSIDNNEVNRVRKELVNQAVTPMRRMADQLERDINNAQSLYNRLSNRKYSITSLVSQGDNNLEEYLNSFPSLEEMFAENANDDGFVLEQIGNGDSSDLRTLYQLIFEMKQSLTEPYDESSNNKFIKEAANSRALLPQHKQEFDKLVSQINDYNYYMFELARLFVAADEDQYSKTAEQLVKDEDAEYLLEVPYTSKMLRLYRQKRGALNQREKAELKNACSDAFPDF